MNKIRGLIVNFLSLTIGRLLLISNPAKAKRLAEEGMTVIMGKSGLSISERLMRRALLKKAERKSNFEELAGFHENYWKNKGADFFNQNDDRLEDVNLPFCEFIFPLLDKELKKKGDSYHTLVEIGTGNGRVLDYLSTKFHSLDRFIGIDLSEEQTKNNKEHYLKNSKLEFVSGDAFDWVCNYGKGNTIFLTFMGVLEYFTESRLKEFLTNVNGLGKIIFVAIEPNGHDHDFEKNPNSQIYGPERSFSHNYQALFKDAGFTLWHFSQKSWLKGTNMQTFIGARN